jgi:Icc-related predicted phosphoesterase
MNILAFVDLHGNDKAWKEVKNKSKNADLIVCGGDISIFENNLELLLKELNQLGKTALIIPGNHEDSQDLDILAKKLKNIVNIHKKSYVNGDYLFLGYGGSGFSINDGEFNALSKKFEKEVRKFGNKKTILVTHAPPYKTNIDKIMDESCGNKSIKNFIVKVKPDLVISGHLHENAGKKDSVGKTKVINPGPYGEIIKL